MINPTEKDIGRSVVYCKDSELGEQEFGGITSFNDVVVFVRYEKQHPTAPGQATRREDLHYSSGVK